MMKMLKCLFAVVVLILSIAETQAQNVTKEVYKKTPTRDLTLKIYSPSGILRKVNTKAVSTSTLRQAMIPEAIYENPDGSGFILDRDFLGNPRMAEKPLPGPFEKQFSGNKIYGVK